MIREGVWSSGFTLLLRMIRRMFARRSDKGVGQMMSAVGLKLNGYRKDANGVG